MAVLLRTNILSGERLDLPDYENIENFVIEDVNAIMKFLMSDSTKIVSGFRIYQDITALNDDPTVSPIYVKLAGSTLIHTDASNNPFFYVGADSLDPEQIDLTSGVTNYLEMDLTTTTSAPDTRAIWDPSANAGEGAEYTQIINTVRDLTISISVNTTGFSGGSKVPLAEIVVDGGGTIVSLIDRRNLFFRLGEGQPENKLYVYPWTSGRTEPDADRKIDSNAFIGADKSIQSFKSWMDAVMTRFIEMSGSPYWFSIASTPVSGLNLADLFFDSIGSTITGTGIWGHDKAIAGRLSWTSDVYIKAVMGDLQFTIPTGSVDLADGEVAYLELVRNVEIVGPVFTFINGNASVTSTVGAFSTFVVGDYIRAKSHSLNTWRRIASFNTGVPATATSVTLDAVYTGATVAEAALRSKGSYTMQVADSSVLSASSNIFWMARRNDDGGSIPKIYLRDASELQQGEDIEISDNTTEEVLRFIGSPNESCSTPPYTHTPNSHLANKFNSGDSLTEAISTNTANINDIIEALLKPYYEDYDVIAPIVSGSLITLPLDSRNFLAQKKYLVGSCALMVFLNGQHLRLDDDWDEVGAVGSFSDQIQILQDLVIGDVLEFRILIPELFGTSPEPIPNQPYYVNYLGNQAVSLLAVGALYNESTNKLDVYRNGTLMLQDSSLGSAVERYSETSSSQITLDSIAVLTDVFVFVNKEEVPTYRLVRTGLTGTNVTLPTYVMGFDQLKVFRNGVLMNSAGLGGAIDRYTEVTSSLITLASTAVPSDIFTIIAESVAPSFREDVTGFTGTVITMAGSYTIGSEELLVYRNGVLLLNSGVLGDAVDRYSETTVNSITLEVAAIATDVFTFINK